MREPFKRADEASTLVQSIVIGDGRGKVTIAKKRLELYASTGTEGSLPPTVSH